MRLLPIFKKAQGDYNLFKSAMNGSDLTGSITNITDMRVDETYLLARRLWDDVLESYTNGNSNDAIILFVDYLEMIHLKPSGFSYKLARNSGGVLVGALWMTATMQRNF